MAFIEPMHRNKPNITYLLHSRVSMIYCFSAAQLMKNTGMLFANDANKDRAKAIVGNLHRLGIINCVVSNYDGRVYPKVRSAGFTGRGTVAYTKEVHLSLAKLPLKSQTSRPRSRWLTSLHSPAGRVPYHEERQKSVQSMSVHQSNLDCRQKRIFEPCGQNKWLLPVNVYSFVTKTTLKNSNMIVVVWLLH